MDIDQSLPSSYYIHIYEKQFDAPLNSLNFAEKMDLIDPLRKYQNCFNIPLMEDMLEAKDVAQNLLIDSDPTTIYLSGNSLGLQPKESVDYLNKEMEKWAKWGVLGHFKCRTEYDVPWAKSEEYLKEGCAMLLGADEADIACLNTITVNLHLMLTSFYKPTPHKFKILLEDKAFPSDFYAIRSQIELKGYNPEEAMVCLKPRDGEYTLRNEDIISYIAEFGDGIALVFFSSVHYYTGNLLDVKAITEAGHSKVCYVGWNFAHAIGNVKINLNEWDIDFAVWSAYKYLNGGPGSIGGIYVNSKYRNNDFPKLLGWWGHKFQTRFIMDNVFDPEPSPAIYKISNSSSLYVGIILASFKIFKEATIEAITMKSYLLTGYLELLIQSLKCENNFIILTPHDPKNRGNQLSIYFKCELKAADICSLLFKKGVVCDVREPNVIRVAPVPLYNTFRQVYRFYLAVKSIVDAL